VLQGLGSVSGVEELHESLVLLPWRISQFLDGTYAFTQNKKRRHKKSKTKTSQSHYLSNEEAEAKVLITQIL